MTWSQLGLPCHRSLAVDVQRLHETFETAVSPQPQDLVIYLFLERAHHRKRVRE